MKAAKEDLRQQMLTLMPFLWDNYLELSAASEIFLLGVGQAYIGIKELLLARGTHTPKFTSPSTTLC